MHGVLAAAAVAGRRQQSAGQLAAPWASRVLRRPGLRTICRSCSLRGGAPQAGQRSVAGAAGWAGTGQGQGWALRSGPRRWEATECGTESNGRQGACTPVAVAGAGGPSCPAPAHPLTTPHSRAYLVSRGLGEAAPLAGERTATGLGAAAGDAGGAAAGAAATAPALACICAPLAAPNVGEDGALRSGGAGWGRGARQRAHCRPKVPPRRREPGLAGPGRARRRPWGNWRECDHRRGEPQGGEGVCSKTGRCGGAWKAGGLPFPSLPAASCNATAPTPSASSTCGPPPAASQGSGHPAGRGAGCRVSPVGFRPACAPRSPVLALSCACGLHDQAFRRVSGPGPTHA